MTSRRHQRLTAVFLRASELPEEERRAYLEQACGDDADLRARVERMLQAEEHPPEILEPGAVGCVVDLEDEALPERIGPYRIEEKLGEGGMGVVFRAEQERPVRRQVALKLIKLGLETKQVLARFETERQALARMNHPAIAHVHDAGMTEQGRPYFAMEYVDGRPITDYCDARRLGVDERLELLMQVAEGVQHAHQKGIIHRDIKTSNVLVTEVDGKPLPKIIDFGIAKATEQLAGDRTSLTQAGQVFGTPASMSPEQLASDAQDVDTRTDVYALGVLLYELLVGRLPFESNDGEGLDELKRMIREDEPPSPATRAATLGDEAALVAAARHEHPVSLRRRLRGELDWITMRALAKERERRYATPAELAADLARHLRDEPVLAGPPSRLYRARKFVRKHRMAVSFAAVLLILLVAFAVAITREADRADRAAVLANEQAQRARDELRHAEGVSAFLIQLFEASGSQGPGGECASVCDVVDGAIGDLEQLGDQPFLQSRLMLMLGKIIQDEGSVVEGRARLNRALSDMDQRPDTIDFLEEAAWKTVILRRLDEAELTFEHLVKVRERKLGARDPETLMTRAELGRVYTLQNRLEEADTRISATLQTMRSALGEEHPYTLRTIGYLASVLWRQGRIDDMGLLLGAALQDMQRVLGDGHYITLATLYNLARVEARRGEKARAFDYLRRAMDGGFIYMGQDAEGRLVMGRPGLLTDPHLAPLHGDPEFDAIVHRAL